MSYQTRAALIAEFRAALATDGYDVITAIYVAAIEHDADHPDEPRLMDDLRAIAAEQMAVA
ncbi:hypothetical protein ACH4GK_31950 [Streptomyces rimosus]|uniref:hypothetical protein n=1 Tax=Streptomyces rimosus TaxID=1927 RepID=UPI0004CC321F|nr:hypothetical protein [Streptomyces rimosus]